MPNASARRGRRACSIPTTRRVIARAGGAHKTAGPLGPQTNRRATTSTGGSDLRSYRDPRLAALKPCQADSRCLHFNTHSVHLRSDHITLFAVLSLQVATVTEPPLSPPLARYAPWMIRPAVRQGGGVSVPTAGSGASSLPSRSATATATRRPVPRTSPNEAARALAPSRAREAAVRRTVLRREGRKHSSSDGDVRCDAHGSSDPATTDTCRAVSIRSVRRPGGAGSTPPPAERPRSTAPSPRVRTRDRAIRRACAGGSPVRPGRA